MNPPYSDDPLVYLVGQAHAPTFFESCYEKQALHCQHDEPQRYADLLSIARIDEIVASGELPPQALTMARAEPRITRENYTFANGNIDRGAVVRQYQLGATIILPQLHLADAKLADFCRAVETALSVNVQTNIYLTPPGSQGFATHYDGHDVFVIQITGEKLWHLYDRPVDNPYRGERFRQGEHPTGEPKHSFVLKPGDCLYIPRGLMHDAATSGDEPSLHITVGLLVKHWADFMLEAVSEVALRDPGFRQSLPVGFARDDFDRNMARELFGDLLKRFSENADFDEVFDLFVETFVRSRESNVSAGILNASLPVSATRKFRLRANVQTCLNTDGERVTMISAGGDLHFEVDALPGLELALSGDVFDRQVFASLSDEAATDTIRKLLAFGVVEALD